MSRIPLVFLILLPYSLAYVNLHRTNEPRSALSGEFACNASKYTNIAQKMEKIHNIGPAIPVRKYHAEDFCSRMIKNSLKNWRRTALDAEYAKEFGWPYRKRHKGGKQDILVFERKAIAVAKWLLLSPIKLAKVCRQIKKKPVLVALGELAQRGANPYALAVFKAIKSAMANAEVKYGSSGLVPKFKELAASVGGYIKKPLFRAKGRCDVIRKPKAHLRVVLTV
ncbi:50S ribosomal protein L17e, putative [Theileria equi strain WA]|uniref:50S ribosomal protein L17e, putative n=1 Tax=Theileria equi strain WA TaxID=1537102 RepID=L0AVG5_THEEQ|nr:50S ribosomal protein L17e, putative [Theileria equi strain WA]AFZ79602.1 50S ribosomal protein L17e, putative [Theileria equi strain WA]|eukprot:XP_004829268.1 50S ribosomal protein L17e, putative [Theileria equi strain WA]